MRMPQCVSRKRLENVESVLSLHSHLASIHLACLVIFNEARLQNSVGFKESTRRSASAIWRHSFFPRLRHACTYAKRACSTRTCDYVKRWVSRVCANKSNASIDRGGTEECSCHPFRLHHTQGIGFLIERHNVALSSVKVCKGPPERANDRNWIRCFDERKHGHARCKLICSRKETRDLSRSVNLRTY